MTDPDDLAPRHDVPTGGRSGFAVVDGRQVHYLEWGHRGRSPLLCLHGGGQTAYMFEELGAALGGGHHVLAIDLPAHGDSDPLPDEAWTRHELAASVPAVMATFGFTRAPIVGASLGGITAMTLAARHPELVAGIVLIDIGHRVEPEGVRRIVEFLSAHESFASLDEAAGEIAKYLPFRKSFRPESLTRNLRQRSDGRWIWKHSMGRRFRDQRAAGGIDPGDMAATNTLMEGLDTDAASLQCPVLILRGDKSDVLSDDGAEEVAALIPDARLARVGNAGHLTAGDNPESVVGLVSSFLAELGW
ncbi:MAG: alpha/beta hydrolase [Acidimicrobiales bacterium]|nr:alpha/beta hydrolase [Acidimicrobiales bacterium]